MAKIVTDRIRIDTLCRERQITEQRLAKRLYEAFNGGEALRKLRVVAARIVDEMLEANDPPLKKVLGECAVLDIFKRFDSLVKVRGGADSLTASDIADILYVCGEWVLAGGGTRKDTWPAKTIQGAYKVGTVSTAPARDGAGWAGRHADASQHAVWKQESGGRFRGNWSGGIEKHLAGLRGPASQPGMASKRSLDGSTVLKVDRLFGLLPGADISGSTSEGVSILERWGSDLLHSAYYLLPMATLVHNMHHTLLEVALTLSLNRIVDYRIGFYTTLLPDVTPPELAEVHNALKDAESETEHFVLYHDGDAPAGCLLFDQAWERLLLREGGFGRATEMLARAQLLPSFPSRADVVALVRATTLGLARGLPSELAPPRVKTTQA